MTDDEPPLVLVADDDVDVAELVRLRLVRNGLRVVVAHDGEAALALARERPPSLAIVDVMMPRLDGHGLVAALRADAATADVPVLVLTAAVQDHKVAGADDTLRKPFSPRALTQRVEALLLARGDGPL